jgi:Putative zinc-finger
MVHTHATGTSTAERYVLGEMSDQEREEYEEHYFDCPECADEVRAAAIFRENAEAIRRDEPERVAEKDTRRGPKEDPKHTRFWQLFWPLPQGALAAAAVMAVALSVTGYRSLVVLPRLQAEMRGGEGIESAPWYPLSVTRGDAPVVTVQPGQRRLGLTLSPSSGRTHSHYRCEVQDAQGRTLVSGVVAGPAEGQELQLLIPTASLRPGNHVLVVTPLESSSGPASSDPPVGYPFALR